MLLNATLLRKSPPWSPNISDEHVSCTALATRNASLQILCKCPAPAIVFGTATNPHVLLTFGKVQNPLLLLRRIASEPSKVVRVCGVLNTLTSKCASRYNSVHFFDISTSKSAPRPSVFNTCDFEMCFAPQWRALFRHLNFQKWSETSFLTLLTWTCALRHNSVQFFISHLTRCLRTRRFSEPTFRPSGATNHWKKHGASWLSHLFAHLHLLSLDSFSSLIVSLPLFLFPSLPFPSLLFSSLLFSSRTLSTYPFPSVHIVGSLTSKLPSMKHQFRPHIYMYSLYSYTTKMDSACSNGQAGTTSRSYSKIPVRIFKKPYTPNIEM